jgi:hypothetical protein
MDKDLEAGNHTREYRPWENDRLPDGNTGRDRQQARQQVDADGGHAQDKRGSRVDRSAQRKRDGRIEPQAQLQHVPHDDADAQACGKP